MRSRLREFARTESRRPALPGHRRRGQAPDHPVLSRVDGPQRLGPGRGAHRAVRVDDRDDPVPGQPGARPALRQVPRTGRHRIVLRLARPHRPAVHAGRPGTGADPRPRRYPGRHRTRPGRGADRLHDRRGPAPGPAVPGGVPVPRRPPRIWQSWDGSDWREARILEDTSEGFNSSGQVTLLLAARHEPLAIGAVRAHWLRCKLIDVVPGQPPYHVSPMLGSVDPVGLGGAVAAHHAEPAPAELLGTSNGRPGQVFQVRRAPVLARRPGETVRVVPPRREPQREPEAMLWTEVADFADAGPEDRVFTWNGATGEIRFGPGVTGRDGRVRQYGAVPEEDAQVFVTGYRHGGGRRGNAGAGKLPVLPPSIPSIESVRNLDPATGGVDAETVENAKIRGPLYLRGGHRAVTATDFERLTLEAA